MVYAYNFILAAAIVWAIKNYPEMVKISEEFEFVWIFYAFQILVYLVGFILVLYFINQCVCNDP
jgi:hypothetical protein